MAQITERREASQPIREKTGGSTFKNPPGDSSWRLVDAAGWRAKPFGGAQFSDKHANFLINDDGATAADLEGLGERPYGREVRARFSVDPRMGRSSVSAGRLRLIARLIRLPAPARAATSLFSFFPTFPPTLPPSTSLVHPTFPLHPFS